MQLIKIIKINIDLNMKLMLRELKYEKLFLHLPVQYFFLLLRKLLGRQLQWMDVTESCCLQDAG